MTRSHPRSPLHDHRTHSKKTPHGLLKSKYSYAETTHGVKGEEPATKRRRLCRDGGKGTSPSPSLPSDTVPHRHYDVQRDGDAASCILMRGLWSWYMGTRIPPPFQKRYKATGQPIGNIPTFSIAKNGAKYSCSKVIKNKSILFSYG